MAVIIPHPPIYLSEIRNFDLWVLLFVGAAWEVASRVLLLRKKAKPESLLQKELTLQLLQHETNQKRKMGPSAFVETSKLERKVLALEKEIDEIRQRRKGEIEELEKKVVKFGSTALSLLVFVLYYGVPILTMETFPDLADFHSDILVVGGGGISGGGLIGSVSPPSSLKPLLFPLSYVGIGTKLSKLGIPAEIADDSISACIVLWCGQATVAKIMDAVDAYYL